MVWWSKLPVWHVLALVALIAVLTWGFLSRDIDDTPTPENAVIAPTSSAPDAVSSKSASSLAISSKSSVESLLKAEMPESSVAKIEAPSIDEVEAAVPISISVETPVEAPVEVLVEAKAKVEPETAQVLLRPTLEPKAAAKAKPARPALTSRAKPALEGLTPDESALMGMAENGYVLQVSAAKSLPALEEFVSSQRNRSSLRIYRSIRSGKSWFVVVEGYYADKDSALAAMSNLPSGQLKAGPWPKSMAAVRLEIAAYKQQTP